MEVFRIDAVPYIWKQLGTTCRNLPQVHTIVRMLRMVLECVCPAVILKGEVVMAPKELAAYFGTPEKPECHMLYNVSTMVNLWGALASRDTRLLKAQLDALHALPDNCWFVNYLRCHDDIGWGLDEAVENRLGIDPQKHKEYLYHFYEGNFPGSWAKGELYNYDPATGDARSCGTTASLCGVEQALEKRHSSVQQQVTFHRVVQCGFIAFFQCLFDTAQAGGGAAASGIAGGRVVVVQLTLCPAAGEIALVEVVQIFFMFLRVNAESFLHRLIQTPAEDVYKRQCQERDHYV